VRINSAVDGQNYYVIRSDDGLQYLHLQGFAGTPQASNAIVVWGSFLGAAQWYRSMPDRVHVFRPDGSFEAAWVVGLEAALVIMGGCGGHLVYFDGAFDQPFTGAPVFVPRDERAIASGLPTSWDRLLRED
jgi:hypothetical protein